MKYEPFCADFKTFPVAFKNMTLALQRLGELDPLHIKKTTLSGVRKGKNNLTDRDLVNRGILNVRKMLNRNLGKTGKYSNRMIRRTAKIKSKENNQFVYLTAYLPKKDTLKIVVATYTMLWTYDKAYCASLLNTELNDNYKEKLNIKNTILKTIFPIQTNIVLRSKPETVTGAKIKEYLKEVAYV